MCRQLGVSMNFSIRRTLRSSLAFCRDLSRWIGTQPICPSYNICPLAIGASAKLCPISWSAFSQIRRFKTMRATIIGHLRCPTCCAFGVLFSIATAHISLTKPLPFALPIESFCHPLWAIECTKACLECSVLSRGTLWSWMEPCPLRLACVEFILHFI